MGLTSKRVHNGPARKRAAVPAGARLLKRLAAAPISRGLI
jgi:hypothetical protein